MVIMALDHIRDLLHSTALTQDPTDLATTTPALFMTRWVTHLCAPTFVFLSGMSAYLSLQKQDAGAARRFLRKRGLVLILLELTVVNFAFWFDIRFHFLLLQVIYAIGAGLVVLSLLNRLSLRWIGGLGLLIVFGHDLLPGLPASVSPVARFGWALLFQPNFFAVSSGFNLFVAYPLIPWLGIMLVGYACGYWIQQSAPIRKQVLLRVGLGTLTLFVLIRLLNTYGDPAPWAMQRNSLFTLLSFINVSKYPPSLLYSLLMVGIALLMLWVADGTDSTLTRWLTVYGKVPMFYYIIHWYGVHLTMLGIALVQGCDLAKPAEGLLTFGRPAGVGISLAGVYGVWICLVIALYPLCRWYGRYKAANPQIGWLRYV